MSSLQDPNVSLKLPFKRRRFLLSKDQQKPTSEDEKESGEDENEWEDTYNSEYSNVEEDVEYSSDDEYSFDDEFSSDDTTLLKPVRYQGIDKDEKDVILKAIRIHESDSSYVHLSSSKELKDQFFDRLKLTGLDHGKRHFRAGPVLQVISVCISNTFSLNKLKIYGHISITDGRHNTYYIYERTSDCPEEVSPGHELSLNGCSVAPVTWGNVEISLFNENEDIREPIVAGKSVVEYSFKDGPKGEKLFPGRNGYSATMVYTIIPYAYIAVVEMYLYKHPHSGDENFFKVHGKIEANKVVCFQKNSSESVLMSNELVNYIEQSTTVFAVPVFSPLLVDVKLHSDQTELANETLQYNPCHLSVTELEFGCYDESFFFGMEVEWYPHSRYFGRKGWLNGVHVKRGPRDHLQVDEPPNHPWVDYEHVKWNSEFPSMGQVHGPPNHPWVDYEHVKWNSEFVSMGQIDQPPEEGPLVEVFSVLVCGGNSDLSVCGTIVVRDGDHTVYIFSRNKNCPDKLSSNKQQCTRSLSLAWPKRWVVEKDFFMHLKLEDDQGETVCRGALDWYFKYDKYPTSYDTRMCSVIQGENGYFAAVHYSIFENGLGAKVTVVCCKGEHYCHRRIRVYGSVVAEYSNYDYLSTYDKECYRSIIFKKSEEDCVVVKNCSKIPLSKGMVSAPLNCGKLIVDLDLVVMAPHKRGCARGRIPFKAGENGVCEMYDGYCGEDCEWECAGCYIKVMVDWVQNSSNSKAHE